MNMYVRDNSELRAAIEQISNQLCFAVDGQFGFSVHPSVTDESIQKLGMLINFLLDAARRSLSDLADRNAKLSELDRLKSDFIANVSHELRTPLTLILGPLQSLLANQSLDAGTRSQLERVSRNAARLSQLVNDLLDFARLEAGRAEISIQPVDVNNLINLIVEDARPVADSRSITIAFNDRLDRSNAQVDPRMFEKIALNLIGNALKFTPTGGRIDVRLRANNKELQLEVADTGIGISKDKLETIFERFQQVESSSNRRFEGTGIGLSLVKGFTELMDGRVNVESEPGKGSTFMVQLPNALCAGVESEEVVPVSLKGTLQALAIERPAHEVNGVIESEDCSKKIVLVVEDNSDMRNYLIECLSADFRVRAAANGKEALEILELLAPDIIVTDLMMPEMDGIELSNSIKKQDRLRHIPIIMLTARAGSESASLCLDAGADDYLGKPFSMFELGSRVNACLRLSSMVAERARLANESARIEEELRTQEALLASEREARQTAENLNRMKDEFLATLSHELRNPLNAILGWSQILRKNALAQGSRDLANGLEVIERNAKSQSQLVSDLLDLNQIRARKIRLDPQEVDLRPLVESVVQSTLPSAFAKGVDLKAEVPQEPVIVCADRTRMQQILGNLISNGIKFTEKGGRVVVSLEARSGKAEIRVTDTGRGISPDFLPQVFERFRQENASITRCYGGLGIGLTVVKQLVELHDGEVSAQSLGEGQGSTFIVTLPLLEMREFNGIRDSIILEDHPLQGVRILVVEDDPDAREMVRRLLEDCRAIVRPAGSAFEAISSCEEELFDIMVADIGMPEMDGYDLMRRIRNLPEDRGGGMPAIALTAFATSTDRMRAMHAGYQLHLGKPIDGNELVKAVAELVAPTR